MPASDVSRGEPAQLRLVGSQRAWLVPFLTAGIACIVAGGLLAAATAYVTTQKTAWATAYIVLVGGVAQAALGAAVAWLSPRADQRWAWISFVGWNLGNAGVLGGQLAGLLILTDAATVVLVASLIVVLMAVRNRHSEDGAPIKPPHPAVLYLFRALVVLLAVTMPIGVALAHLSA